MAIDWSISVGNLIQLVTLILGALSVFMGLSYRIKGVEKEILQLSGVVVTLAVQKTEIEHLSKRVDGLAEGRGFHLETVPKILKRHQI
jgi:hypothetical protein